MNITLPDVWTIFFGSLTVASVIIAIYQTSSMAKVKRVNAMLQKANEELRKANEKKCATRCKMIADITGDLADNLSTACQVVSQFCSGNIRHNLRPF